MPYNGSGTYTPPAADFPAVTQTVISSTKFNNILNDVAAALTNAVTRDGQSPMTAALPMGGWPINAVALGTAAAPSINFSGASTTGFFATAGALGFSVAGVERMRLDSSGNLGIGTASPGTKLESAGTSNGATLELLRLNNSGSGANTQAQINFVAAASSYATITGGFGAAAPQMTFNLPNAAGGNFVWQITSTERMRLDSSGNLGIGTASPGTRLDVQGPAVTEASIRLTSLIDGTIATPRASSFSFRSGTTPSETARIASFNRFGNVNGGDLVFSTADSSNVLQQRAVIDSSGNLGIGTASPSYRLDVNRASYGVTAAFRSTDGTNNPRFVIYGDANGTTLQHTFSSTAAALIFANGGAEGAGTERMRITNAGNIVAGGSVALATTATDGFLYVPTCAGTPTGTPTAITGMAPIVVNTTNNKLYFYSGGAWRDAGP